MPARGQQLAGARLAGTGRPYQHPGSAGAHAVNAGVAALR
jgi:hypothetical protein